MKNVLFLFFLDSEYNLPNGVTDQEIIDLVSLEVEQVKKCGRLSCSFILYSIGNQDTIFTKEIAYAVDGHWAGVTTRTQ